jgi:hypothetical protein
MMKKKKSKEKHANGGDEHVEEEVNLITKITFRSLPCIVVFTMMLFITAVNVCRSEKNESEADLICFD